jgi:peptide/nickel transport system substrate-binding protein
VKTIWLIAAALLAVMQAAHAQNHRGGTLKLVAASSDGSIDPQVNYTDQYWQLFIVAYDGLVAFRKSAGSSSNDIVPDLATSVPAPQDGGKTYVFKLRQNIKFSNGQPVTPADVVASFERLFKVNNPNAGSWYNNIVGGDKCLTAPATCTLPDGVVAGDDGTITIHLVKPNPEFLYQIALPFGAILPAATPPHDMGTIPIPGTGPYAITSYDPQKAFILQRNPYFKVFSPEAQPDGYVNEIDFEFGVTGENAVTAIENGQYDLDMDPSLPADRLAEMSTRFPRQIYINPLLADYYAPMNVNIPPFSNLNARLAVNYALNRRDTVQIYGGKNLGVPACQILPPGFPGYQPYCPYTKNPGPKWTAPDLAKAQSYMQKSGMAGQKVTVITDDEGVDPALGTYLGSVLNQLGFVATTHVLSANIQFNYIQNTNNKVQISITLWYDDYPAPSDFLNVLLTCGQIHPGSDNSVNIAGYCNKQYDAKVQAALRDAITDPAKANTEWAAIDKQATDAAAWATLFNPKQLDFVSARLGNYTFSEQFHLLFDKVWVQ